MAEEQSPQPTQEMMEVDRRVESEESGDDEGKRQSCALVAELSQQSLKDGEERGEQDPEGAASGHGHHQPGQRRRGNDEPLPTPRRGTCCPPQTRQVPCGPAPCAPTWARDTRDHKGSAVGGGCAGADTDRPPPRGLCPSLRSSPSPQTSEVTDLLWPARHAPGQRSGPPAPPTHSPSSRLQDVDLNHCRIGKIEGFEVLRKVKTLCLRQNLIKCVENLETLQSLQELDLYDNQIRKMENLEALTGLEVLDISFNLLRNIEGVEKLTRLKKLFLVNNKISKIENLGTLQELQMLELGSNRIRAIENLDMLSCLESLFLGKNKITKLQNLDALTNLTVLSMQSNRLTKMEGLQSLVNLRELYLSHNGIEVIEGLENNNKLTMLDIASNRIKKIENISHLTELQEFWMNDNLLESWSDLDELKGAACLETVYLERNPLQKDPQYRRKIMLALPTVRQIDATFVRF